MTSRSILVLAMILAGSGCATQSIVRGSGGDAGTDLASTSDSRRWVIAHRFSHEAKTSNGAQWQSVEYGWDYDQAVAFERTSTMAGELVSHVERPGLILRATEAEQQVAIDLVKRHPDLAATVSRPDAVFESGFIHMELDDEHCHLKSRCVYVLVVLDQGRTKIAQSIVDLQTERVVYPVFDPVMIDPID